MLNSLGNSGKLTNSIQRDYYEAAENYRLAKACGDEQNRARRRFRVGLMVTAVILFCAIVVQSGII